jgi:hypothetical protein
MNLRLVLFLFLVLVLDFLEVSEDEEKKVCPWKAPSPRPSPPPRWRGARVEERTCSVNVRLAMDKLYLHFRLIQSALGQKAEAKPMGLPHRERSQSRAAMRGYEVACLPGELGPHLGQSHERASPFLAKFVLSAFSATGRDAAHAVSGAPMARVSPATTPRTQYVRFTDEVPRRLAPQGRVSPGYKSDTKGWGYASEAGTAFPRPRLKGCQQRQSRGASVRLTAHLCSERQNLGVLPGSIRFMGPVSPAIAATKWPGQTSSGQSVGLLSNSPQQPETRRVAVSSR